MGQDTTGQEGDGTRQDMTAQHSTVLTGEATRSAGIRLRVSPDNAEHHGLDGADAQVLGRLLHLVLQHVLHDEDDVLDELRVVVVHDHLAESGSDGSVPLAGRSGGNHTV